MQGRWHAGVVCAKRRAQSMSLPCPSNSRFPEEPSTAMRLVLLMTFCSIQFSPLCPSVQKPDAKVSATGGRSPSCHWRSSNCFRRCWYASSLSPGSRDGSVARHSFRRCLYVWSLSPGSRDGLGSISAVAAASTGSS